MTAKFHGCKSIAMTDINNLYGLIFFIQTAKAHDLKPIVGVEIVDRRNNRATLLVKSLTGYRNLSHLLTNRHLDESFDLRAGLVERSEGLVVLTDQPLMLDRLKNLSKDLYAEISPGWMNWNLLKYARENRIPVVATPRSFWSKPEGYQLHRLNRAISLNTTLQSLRSDQLAPMTSCFIDEKELRAICEISPHAVDNSLVIAEKCDWIPDFGVVYPDVGEDTLQKLREMTYRGALKRYGEVDEIVRTRIEYEMSMIAERGFAPIFLIVEEIVRQASRTCGRGSAAASIVSYSLGITNVDPIRYNLFFERFINPARVDPPDIDIDFAWDERDDILQFIFNKYGEDRAAMVANHVTLQPRAALREVAKVYGIPDGEISQATKRIEHANTYMEIPGVTSNAAGTLPKPWPEIISLSKQLKGVPRNISVHCGGVVITPGPTADWVPTQMAAKGVRVIHWEKDQTEDAGLVKIDILGNRSLAVIRDARAAVKSHLGIDIDSAGVSPQDDPKTQGLVIKGDTMGVFYVESPATRLLQKKAGMGDYDHMVLHSSIIRPAAAKFIGLYLRRLKGEPWEPLHPAIGDILDENYGVMAYQEDVTRVAMRLADFPLSEADELRKILTKKHKKRRLHELKEQFYDGAARNGADQATIDRIWEMIMSFAGYSFCKPHSASYAIVSFQSAYLRAHYPAEFIAAVISNQGGFYATFAYVSEAKRMGLQILKPDINKSEFSYVGHENWVRIGFMQIKGLTEIAVTRILNARIESPFTSFSDCMQRASLTPADARLLVLAGCFDELEPRRTRPELLWQVVLSDRQTNKAGLFDRISEPGKKLPQTPEFDEATLLRQEIEVLGFLASRHPLELHRDALKRRPVVQACQLERYVGRRVEVAGWLVTGKIVPTKHNEPMEFVTFEDTSALIETVFFPDAFRRFSQMLTYTRPYRVYGRVCEEFGAITMEVDRVEYL